MAASQTQSVSPDVVPNAPEVAGSGPGLVNQQAVGNQAMLDRLGLVAPKTRNGPGAGPRQTEAAPAAAAAVVDGSSVVLARGADTSRGNLLAYASRV